ncbi:MAG: hypothetical protein N3G19_00730 [Candidatus Pacearchaeota archaeon]|nr:hypothetical protein [Candidatus Pacearchaeota archaeon]
MKALIASLILVLLVFAVVVSGAGCDKENAEADAKSLDSELNDLENMNNEVDSLNIDELSESDLEEIEGLL